MNIGGAGETLYNRMGEVLQKAMVSADTQAKNLAQRGRSYVVIRKHEGQETVEGTDSLLSYIFSLFSSEVTKTNKEKIESSAKKELDTALKEVEKHTKTLQGELRAVSQLDRKSNDFKQRIEKLTMGGQALKVILERITGIATASNITLNSENVVKEFESLKSEFAVVADNSAFSAREKMELLGTIREQLLTGKDTLRDCKQVVAEVPKKGLEKLSETERKQYKDNVLAIVKFHSDRIAGQISSEGSDQGIRQLSQDLSAISTILQKLAEQLPSCDLNTEKTNLKNLTLETVKKAKANFSPTMPWENIKEEYQLFHESMNLLGHHQLVDANADCASVRSAISERLHKNLDDHIQRLGSQAKETGIRHSQLQNEISKLESDISPFRAWPELYLQGDKSVIKASQFLNLLRQFQEYFDATEGIKKQMYPQLRSDAKALGIAIGNQPDRTSICHQLKLQTERMLNELNTAETPSTEKQILEAMKLSVSPKAIKKEIEAWKVGSKNALEQLYMRNQKFLDLHADKLKSLRESQMAFEKSGDFDVLWRMKNDVATLFENSQEYEQYCRRIADTLETYASEAMKEEYSELKEDTPSKYLEQLKEASITHQRNFLLQRNKYGEFEALKGEYTTKLTRANELDTQLSDLADSLDALPALKDALERNKSRSKESLANAIINHPEVRKNLGNYDAKKIQANPKQLNTVLTIAKEAINRDPKLISLKIDLLSFNFLQAKKEASDTFLNQSKNFQTLVSRTLDEAAQIEEHLREEIEMAMTKEFGSLYAEARRDQQDFTSVIALQQKSLEKAREGLKSAEKMLEANGKIVDKKNERDLEFSRLEEIQKHIAGLVNLKAAVAANQDNDGAFTRNLQSHIDAAIAA